MPELTRFARKLVELLGGSPGGVHRAVSLDEVRGTILPYRLHRRSLELESVEDYETVLLRLAAEERGYVKTLPPAAADRCRAELGEPSPDLGLLDELAGATIQIGAEALARIVGEEAPVVAAAPGRSYELADEEAVPISRLAAPPTPPRAPAPPPPPPAPTPPPPRAQDIAPEPMPVPPKPAPPKPVLPKAPRAQKPSPEPVPAATPPRPEPPMATPAESSIQCTACHKPLPSGRAVVFCPWCGERLIPFACGRCGTQLESAWRHCINCGAEVKDPHHYA